MATMICQKSARDLSGMHEGKLGSTAKLLLGGSAKAMPIHVYAYTCPTCLGPCFQCIL